MVDSDAKRKKRLKTFVKLSWAILEHKWRYYEGAKYNVKPISDEEYDELEERYKRLAKKLGKEPTACNHVGFPSDTPSGNMVARRMRQTKGKSDIKFKFKRK